MNYVCCYFVEGYTDDGREIFDDELDEEPQQNTKKQTKKTVSISEMLLMK